MTTHPDPHADKVARLELRRVRMGSNTFALDLTDGRSVEFAGRPDTAKEGDTKGG